MDKNLKIAKNQIINHLLKIETLFNKPMKITIMIRDPQNEESELLISDDSIEEIRKLIDRSETRIPE